MVRDLRMEQRQAEQGISVVVGRSASEVSAAAERILDEAVAFCAQKMRANPEAVVEQLRQGECTARNYYDYGLAKGIAAFLGEVMEDVKGVFLCSYDATPEDVCFGEASPLIHLIVWVGRKTAALNSLISALDQAVLRVHAVRCGAPPLKNLLDVQVVDDADVEGRIGYGAMLSSVGNRPICIWTR